MGAQFNDAIPILLMGRFRTVCYPAPDLVKRTFGLRPRSSHRTAFAE